MTRVLQVIHSMNLGGAENFIMNIYRMIDRSEIQFDFLVNADGTFDEEITQMGGKIWKMPYVRTAGPIRYRAELKRFFSDHPEYQIVHSHLDMVSGEVVECAKKAGVKLCVTHSHSTNTTGNFLIKLIKNYYKRKISRYADVCLACSKRAGRWLYGNERVIEIKNAIDVQKFQFYPEIRDEMREGYHISDDTLVIGHVGRFDKMKNHRFLVEVFKKYHERNEKTVLLLCGDGAEKEKIRKSVEKEHLSKNVIFFDASTDVYKMYNAMDVFVFPSFYEGLSLAMLEAQANGLPIVASNAIDAQSNLTGNITFLGLDDTLDSWVKAVAKAGERGRCNGQEQLKRAGYDIRDTVNQLLKCYRIIP